MNRAIPFLIYILLTGTVYAQVGRVEVTMDTVPVGGDEQRARMQAMEAHDRLKDDLIQLKDSLQTSIQDADPASHAAMQSAHKRLSQMITKLQNSEAGAHLYRQGTALLEQTRREFKAMKPGVSKPR